MKNNAAAGVFLYFTQQTDKLEFSGFAELTIDN